MPPVNPTAPAIGQPTRKSFFQALCDAIAWLNGQLTSGTQPSVPNGSFEVGSGANTSPAGWVSVAGTGNTTAFETTAGNVQHGKQAFSMSTPGGASGGVVLTMGDFTAIGELQDFLFSWWMKSTVAGILNKVQVAWYDNSQSLISTVLLYTSTANSLTWVKESVYATSPTGGRFFKLIFTGVDNTTPGQVFWDGVDVQLSGNGPLVAQGAGTYTGTVPQNKRSALVRGRSGGGGGGGGGTDDGSDGGAFSFAVQAGTFTLPGGNHGQQGNTGGIAGAAHSSSVTCSGYLQEILGGSAGSNGNSTTGASGAGGNEPTTNTGGGASVGAGTTGNSGSTPGAGGGGGGNTGGRAGGGGGGPGCFGYFIIPVVPGEPWTMVVPSGGVPGGNDGIGSPRPGGNGADGSGAIIFI